MSEKDIRPQELLPIVAQIMGDHYQCGVAMRDSIIPFAVRWYTGEACADDDDDDSFDEADEYAIDEVGLIDVPAEMMRDLFHAHVVNKVI